MIINRTSAPATPLLSLQEAKEYLRVDGTDEDALIVQLVQSVTDYLDGPYGRIGQALISQTWEIQSRGMSGRAEFHMPITPLITLDSITYFDRDNVSQTATVGDYTTYKDRHQAWIVPDIGENWPQVYDRPDAMTITATFGFGTSPNDVPANILNVSRRYLEHLYENRGDYVVDMDAKILLYGFDHAINLNRVGWFGG